MKTYKSFFFTTKRLSLDLGVDLLELGIGFGVSCSLFDSLSITLDLGPLYAHFNIRL